MKDILWGDNVRAKLMEGIEILNNTVKITLGPKGKNVILDKIYGSPLITKDGVTVAKEIDLKDKFQNMGAQIIKEVASRTSETAGDGTTTATILAHFMIKEGMKYITSGINPMDLKRGIEKATLEAIRELKSLTKSCSSLKEISQVASVSANNDKDIGTIISRAVDRIGKEGVITIEDGKSLDNELEIVEGLQFDRGYMSTYFINDHENQSSKLENAFILICNKKINTLYELIPVLELVSKSNRPLLIMAEEIDNEILATLILNNIKGVLKLSAVKLPGFGDKRKDLLDDIAILTGGTVITDEIGLSSENASLADLGQAKKIEVYKEKTIIIDGAGIPCNISQRVKDLSQQVIVSNSQYEKEKLQERLSKLSNGIAIIRVGAATELEMKEKKARFEDALHATRAAIEEGIVAGGGVTLLRLKGLLKNLTGENEDQNSGIKLVLKSMEEPLKQILLNAGEEFSMVITNILNNSENIDYGYNVSNRTYGNLMDLGVIDPTKVTRTALQNASSIASLLLTTEAGVVEIKKFNNSKNLDNDNDLDDTTDI